MHGPIGPKVLHFSPDGLPPEDVTNSWPIRFSPESFKSESPKTAHGFHANNDLPEVRYQVCKLLRERV